MKKGIARLRKEGIFDINKLLRLPLLPQRIAIISVETSKGYSDFLKVIDKNSWGYKFFHHLFPSLLQGDRSVDSIMGQLERIKKVKHHFDVVAIIRGGGGDVRTRAGRDGGELRIRIDDDDGDGRGAGPTMSVTGCGRTGQGFAR